MKVRAIRESDPTYGTGNNNFIYDAEAVTELLNTRLSTFKGEVKRNVNFGIPNMKGLDKEDLDIEIGDIIISTAGVLRISKFESTLIDRKYTASITVISEFGALEVQI